MCLPGFRLAGVNKVRHHLSTDTTDAGGTQLPENQVSVELKKFQLGKDLPEYLDNKRCGYYCRVSEDKLSAKYCGTGIHDDVGAVQANLPVPRDRVRFYFEITVENRGRSGKIAIGFTDEKFSLSEYPGLDSNTYGYHGDDGILYRYQVKKRPRGGTFSAGDTVGAGLDYETKKIFFTKNGRLVGNLAYDGTSDGPLMYPTVALLSPNGKVVANFGQSTFLFDPVQPPSSKGFPTYLDKWRCGYHCRLSEDKLSVEYSGARGDGVGAVQANLPISFEKRRYYFEMTVENEEEPGNIAIGFTVENFSLLQFPGFESNSLGYHGYEGVFCRFPVEKPAPGVTFSAGETVGAGLNYETKKIYFTKNGRLVGKLAHDDIFDGQLLYPTIALNKPGGKVVANFGQSTFLFDPVQPPSSSEGLPTYLDKRRCGDNCRLSEDKLSAEYSGTSDDGVGAVQANLPISLEKLRYYFEMTVDNRGQSGKIAIGFTHENFTLGQSPGLESNSYGYDGSNDGLQCCGGIKSPFDPEFLSGDTVGAGLNYECKKVFFTKNGKLVGTAELDGTTEGPLYPTIGLESPNDQVVVNFGQRPFVLDPVELPSFESGGLPTYLHNWRVGFHCIVSEDNLSVEYSGSSHDSAGALQADEPVPLDSLPYYFEMTVENSGITRNIAIGFTDETFSLRRLPGCGSNSYGYHGNDGSLYRCSKEGVPFGPSFSAGDTVGAGLNYKTKQIFFTKNGKWVGTTELDGTTDFEGALYPTVGLGSPDEKLVVNFGQSRFVFDEPAVDCVAHGYQQPV